MSSCSGKDGRALSLEKGVPLARMKGRFGHFLADSNGHSAGRYSYAGVGVILSVTSMSACRNALLAVAHHGLVDQQIMFDPK